MRKKSKVIEYLIKLILVSFILLNVLPAVVSAQMSNYISAVKTGEAKEKSPLTITADIIAPQNISSITISFRVFGQNEYYKMEMILAGLSAKVTIPSNYIQPGFIEYYITVDLKNGTSQTYPQDIEQGVSPLQIAVTGVSEKDNEVIILNPDEGEMISDSDFLITISFFKASDNVDVSKTKIFLNNSDITSSELITDDLIIISGENLNNIPPGAKNLRVDIYDKEGKLYNSINKSFQVVSNINVENLVSGMKYNGNFRAESRNENYNNASNWYNNISSDLNASYQNWRINVNAYFTSEEKNNLQPYDRYSASLQNGSWLNLKLGDSYPRFPNLIMDGKRVRGFSGELKFGVVNILTSIGETVRKIEGRLTTIYPVGQSPLGSNIISIGNNQYAEAVLGTYSRQVFALRPSFGSGENFQFGLSYLHSKDDPGSVQYSARPQENAVFGTDLMFTLDDKNIVFTSQAALSLINNDISSGELTDTQIDSLFGPGKYIDMNPDDVKTIRDIAGKFITINQYIAPLNPQELASLAAEAAVSFNYFNNLLKTSYVYRGNDYQSFGQSYIRTDVSGINISDRIRMINDKVFLSLGYERLEDNLQKTKIATTAFQTISASVSVFPRANFPNITVGFINYNNNNGIASADTSRNKYMIDESTNRILVSLSYDIRAGVRHSASLSFSTQNRNDKSLLNSDSKFNSGILGVNSYWTTSLNSVLQIIYSSSEIMGAPFNYFTLVAGAKYRMLEDDLLLSLTLSPSFGDFDRQAFEFLADYKLFTNFSLVLQSRIFRFPGKSTNSITGLTTRYSF